MNFRLSCAVVLAALAALAGCQSRAVLTEFPVVIKDGQGQKYTSNQALFSVSDKGRQTIVLAFQPTGAADAPPPTPPPPPPGMTPLPKPTPMQYRAYLMLVVNGGGGEFKIGQPFRGGEVRAAYYLYDPLGQPVIVPDSRGTIKTTVWPLLGSLDPNEWWISGTFDLVMGNQTKLTGEFIARPAPVLVGRFLRDHKL